MTNANLTFGLHPSAEQPLSERAHFDGPNLHHEPLGAVPYGSGPRFLAILATPPLVTSGERTLARVRIAAELIGTTSVVIANLLNVATTDVRDGE